MLAVISDLRRYKIMYSYMKEPFYLTSPPCGSLDDAIESLKIFVPATAMPIIAWVVLDDEVLLNTEEML